MAAKEQYGGGYWCVGLEDGAEVYAYADEVRVEPSGALLLMRGPREEQPVQVNLAFATGQWRFIYAASVLDRHPVAAVHWPGHIAEASPDDWAT